MKVLVAVKRVVDFNVKIRVKADGSGVELANVKMSMNPFDEIAVEEAIRLREAGKASEVVAVSIGPAQAQETIRNALAMGADRGILVNDEQLAGADAFLTASALAAAIGGESPDLVICATESYDGSTGMVPPMLAELLGLPQLTFAKHVEVGDGRLTVHRQTETGYQVVVADTPGLVTVTAGIAEPRYASLKGIMAARSKEVKVLGLGDLGIERGEPAETVEEIVDAEARKSGEIVEDDGTVGVERIMAVLQAAKVV